MSYKKDEKQYIADLTALSGGYPKKGLADKISFYAVFIMNGILYDESQVREGAETLREVRKFSLECF